MSEATACTQRHWLEVKEFRAFSPPFSRWSPGFAKLRRPGRQLPLGPTSGGEADKTQERRQPRRRLAHGRYPTWRPDGPRGPGAPSRLQDRRRLHPGSQPNGETPAPKAPPTTKGGRTPGHGQGQPCRGHREGCKDRGATQQGGHQLSRSGGGILGSRANAIAEKGALKCRWSEAAPSLPPMSGRGDGAGGLVPAAPLFSSRSTLRPGREGKTWKQEVSREMRQTHTPVVPSSPNRSGCWPQEEGRESTGGRGQTSPGFGEVENGRGNGADLAV